MFDYSQNPEELLALKDKMAKIQENNLEKAKRVVKIIEQEEWQEISAFIESLKQEFARTPEEYFENEKLVGIDSGARSALTLFTNWIASQINIIDQYEQKKE